MRAPAALLSRKCDSRERAGSVHHRLDEAVGLGDGRREVLDQAVHVHLDLRRLVLQRGQRLARSGCASGRAPGRGTRTAPARSSIPRCAWPPACGRSCAGFRAAWPRCRAGIRRSGTASPPPPTRGTGPAPRGPRRRCASSHRFRAALAALQFRRHLVVLLLQVAAIELHHRAELLERVLEDLLRLLLRVAGLAHARHEDVALLLAELLHRAVVHRGASAQRGQQGRGQSDPNVLFSWRAILVRAAVSSTRKTRPRRCAGQKERPPFPGAAGLARLVEAAGVEPASAQALHRHLHA